MNNVSLISIDDFKNGILRGASTMEHTKEVAEKFLTCSIRGLIAEKMNNDCAANTLLDAVKSHRWREDGRSDRKGLNVFSEYQEIFGRQARDLTSDDASALALIGGLSGEDRYDHDYVPTPGQDTKEYRRSMTDLHEKAIPFFNLTIQDFFAYLELLSPKMKDIYETWFKEDDEEYLRINNSRASIAYVLDKASDAAIVTDRQFPNAGAMLWEAVRHPGHPFEYTEDDPEYEMSLGDQITGYERINFLMNKALRLIRQYRKFSLQEIGFVQDSPYEQETNEIGTDETLFEMDGCLYVGDPRHYRDSVKNGGD